MASASTPFLGVEMSGLSYPETEGCRKLLGLLENEEIMALCDTITNRLVQPEDRQGKGRASPTAAAPPRASAAPRERPRRAGRARPRPQPVPRTPGVAAAAVPSCPAAVEPRRSPGLLWH